MQQIERYGVIALVFLLVTIVAVSFWGDSKSPGFWARLTGKAKKQDVAQLDPATAPLFQPLTSPATTSEQALQTSLALNPTPSPELGAAAQPAPITAPATAPATNVADPFAPSATQPPALVDPLAVNTPPSNGAPAGLGAAPASVNAPVAPVQDVPAPEPASARTYVVQKGDSLARIARRTLGAESRWTEIQALNGGVTPSKLQVGMKLTLPAGADVKGAAATAAASSLASKPAGAKPSAHSSKPEARKAAPAGAGVVFYTVRKGDTLHAIAEKKLGGKSHVRDILALNPGLDPRRISVGAKIKLPAAGKEQVVAAAAPSSGSSRPHVR